MYKCTWTGGVVPKDPADVCTAVNICDGDPRIAKWEIDYSNPDSLHNWQQKLDLKCIPLEAGLLGTALFAGWCVTLLWVPGLADKYGRQKLFRFGMLCDFICWNVLMFTHDVHVMLVTIFCFGMLSSIRINVGYVYLQELMPRSRATFYGTLWNNCECAIYPLATIYFWKISKHWVYFSSIGYALSLWSAVATFFLPESPRWLYSKQRLDRVGSSLRTVAWWSGRKSQFNIDEYRIVASEEGPGCLSPKPIEHSSDGASTRIGVSDSGR